MCPGCGDIVESFATLTSATAHYFCQVCSATRDTDLSDFVEVTFGVAKQIRELRYHDPYPGYLYFTNGPALVITDERVDETRRVAFAYTAPGRRASKASSRPAPSAWNSRTGPAARHAGADRRLQRRGR